MVAVLLLLLRKALRAEVSLGTRPLLLVEAGLLLLLHEDVLLCYILLLLLGVRREELEGQADRLVPQSWTCKKIFKYLTVLGSGSHRYSLGPSRICDNSVQYLKDPSTFNNLSVLLIFTSPLTHHAKLF